MMYGIGRQYYIRVTCTVPLSQNAADCRCRLGLTDESAVARWAVDAPYTPSRCMGTWSVAVAGQSVHAERPVQAGGLLISQKVSKKIKNPELNRVCCNISPIRSQRIVQLSYRLEMEKIMTNQRRIRHL